MKDLIERLEAATGPDRELDVAIIYALHPDIGPYRPHCVGEEPIFWNEPYRKRACPKFTSSIEAELTLVPKGWAWGVGCCCVSDDAWITPDYNSPIHG
jgi:hypothetical protein